MAKVPFSLSVESEIKEEVQRMAQEKEWSDSFMAEKVLKAGLESLRKKEKQQTKK